MIYIELWKFFLFYSNFVSQTSFPDKTENIKIKKRDVMAPKIFYLALFYDKYLYINK